MSMTPQEAALAGLLHDIGKLAQRAHPNEDGLHARSRSMAETLLPPGRGGRHTHRHALWTDHFFEWAQDSRLRWPDGIDAKRVQAAAGCHHKPDDTRPFTHIITEADRLASGLERKAKDEEAEEAGRSFRDISLLALQTRVSIGQGEVPRGPFCHPAEELSADALIPTAPRPADQPRAYGLLWDSWCKGWQAFAGTRLSADRFEQAALALSERLLWAVPSSTVDQPDVSLHDHGAAVGAIAAALAGFHAAAGNAEDLAAIRNRETPKFRLLVLDLSGIQDTLFRLAGSRGAARILRARSFLMGETVAGAVLGLRQRLGLPACSVTMQAGGKAELLVPALPGLDDDVAALRRDLDQWMVAGWQGDLALNLAMTAPFPAKAFMARGRDLAAVRAELRAALERAKMQPLSAWVDATGRTGTGIISAPFGADGACASCGVRPATRLSDLDGAARCTVCDESHTLGQRLPRAAGFVIAARDGAEPGEDSAGLPLGLALQPWLRDGADVVSKIGFAADAGSALPRTPAYVPRITDPDAAHYRHVGLGTDQAEDRAEVGDLMTFGHIAAEALEPAPRGGFVGRALLGVVKADVDRLGAVFRDGLGEDYSPARIAQLSRVMDGYFTRRLPMLLQREYAATYTVYAGGDDLLLICPWRFALPLAVRLRQDFGDFAGGNPNLTLSAGIAFVHPDHPVGRAVLEADEMLDRAKTAGRNRVGILDRVLTWVEAERTLKQAEELSDAVRAEQIAPTFLHRVRDFAAARRRLSLPNVTRRPSDVGWAARWSYHRKRWLDRSEAAGRNEAAPLLDAMLPPPAARQGTSAPMDAEIACTLALWRNR